MKKEFKGEYPSNVTSEAVRDLFTMHKHLKQSNGKNPHVDPSMEQVSMEVVQNAILPIMIDINNWANKLTKARIGNLKGANSNG